MGIREILTECEKLGIVLELEDGRLRFTAPEGSMKPELKTKIARQRKEITEHLYDRFFDSFLQSAMDEIKEAHIDFKSLPLQIRRDSLRLEEELTEAANQRDANAFEDKVIRWRDMLLRNRMD